MSEVKCKERVWMRFGLFAVTLILAIFVASEFSSTVSKLFVVLFFAFVIISSQIYFPDIVVSIDGLTVRSLNRHFFFRWDNVDGVHKNTLHTLIYIRSAELSRMDRLFVARPFSLGRWRKNYDQVTLLIKENTGDKFFETI